MMPRMRKGLVMITVAAATALPVSPGVPLPTTSRRRRRAVTSATRGPWPRSRPACSPSAPTSPPTRRGSSTTTRPTARASSPRWPTPWPTSSATAPKTSNGSAVPFNAAIAPGPKTFDANLNEFSITEERKNAVDFSSPYYDVTQAVVTIKSSPAAKVHQPGRSEGSAPRRPGRYHQLQRRQSPQHQGAGLRLQQQRRRQGRADQRPDRRAGARPADRVRGAK